MQPQVGDVSNPHQL